MAEKRRQNFGAKKLKPLVPGEKVGKEGKVSFLKNERKEKVRQLAREMKIKNRQRCVFCFLRD